MISETVSPNFVLECVNQTRIYATQSDGGHHASSKSTTGTIAFTDEVKSELSEYFSPAGVRLDSIKTHDDYLQARKKASPYFWSCFRGRPDNGLKIMSGTLF